jgi:proline iminopeptidase
MNPRRGAALAALFLTLAAAPAAAASAADVIHAPHAGGVDGRYAVTADGVRIWYEVEGDRPGPPIVCIAGGPGAPHNGFHLTHGRLRELARVVYLDNRGRGRSGPGTGPRPYTIENDVADVEAVRQAIGADSIIVYGRSYGGMVAQAYALAYPGHVRALVLSNTLDGARAWQEENIAATHAFLERQFPERWKRVLERRAAGFVTSQDSLIALMTPLNELYAYDLANDSTFLFRLREVREAGVPGHAPEVYRAMVGRDPEWTVDGTLAGVEFGPRLPALRVPTLVIAGRYDRICPPSTATRIAAAVPGARLVVFERSGHRPELEQADHWFMTMKEFLAGVSASSSSSSSSPP